MKEEKYDRIGIDYNQTRKADPYLVSRLLEHLQPEKGKTYLDVGCGTGNYTRALAAPGFAFVGVDPSERMLAKARTPASDVQWLPGHAEGIPLPAASVDGAVGTLTLHHWDSLEKGFAEITRVLKPGGRAVFFTSTPRQMEGYWLRHYFPTMLADSIRQMPSLETVEGALGQGGLRIMATEPYFVRNNLEDLFLYAGKHRPELYLDPAVRKGISSFSALANAEEVHAGLERLQKDLASDALQGVIEKYRNEWGDYLFVVGSNLPHLPRRLDP